MLLICDKKHGKCKGYGFINFLHPLYLIDFYSAYNGKTWKQDLKSGRVIELCYATKETWNSNFTWMNSQKILNSANSGTEGVEESKY
jgi:RNA recognition motif-containing protein